MTSEQIAELRKLEAKASPGPWRPLVDENGVTVFPPDGVTWCWLYDANGQDVVTWGHDEGGVEREEDGRFIVAARNALPRLLDEREALLKAARAIYPEGAPVRTGAWDVRALADAIAKAESP